MPAKFIGKMPAYDTSVAENLGLAFKEIEFVLPVQDIAQLAWKKSDPALLKIKEDIQRGHLLPVLNAVDRDPRLLEIRDETGYTPLLYAVYLNKPEIVAMLLKRGADPNAKTKDGLNAIDLAIHLGHKDVLEILTAKQPAK